MGMMGACDRSNPGEAELIELDTGIFEVMGTYGKIRVRADSADRTRQAVAAAQEALAKADSFFSTYRQDSDLGRVNQLGHNQAVPVKPETYELLTDALAYGRGTNGAFDITIAPLLALWKHAASEDRLPSPEELAEARRRVGYGKVALDPGPPATVRLAVEGMKLNVDAIAKGRAVDWALDALRQAGAPAALVEIGGEIGCFGTNAWRIGIQDPWVKDHENPLVPRVRWVLELRNAAVATSGNYRRFFTIGGRGYSHIIDPATGKPADVVPSVTVIAPKTADADAIATALSVMGPDAGLAWVESMPGVEAMLVLGEPEHEVLRRSSGFARYEMGENRTEPGRKKR